MPLPAALLLLPVLSQSSPKPLSAATGMRDSKRERDGAPSAAMGAGTTGAGRQAGGQALPERQQSGCTLTASQLAIQVLGGLNACDARGGRRAAGRERQRVRAGVAWLVQRRPCKRPHRSLLPLQVPSGLRASGLAACRRQTRRVGRLRVAKRPHRAATGSGPPRTQPQGCGGRCAAAPSGAARGHPRRRTP